MISVSGKKWAQQKVNKNLVEKVKKDYGFSDIWSQLIISRKYDISEIYGIKNKQKITNLFKDDNDYQKASALLFEAFRNNENNINIIAQIYENFWNNKKSISLNIKNLNL